MIAAHLVAAEHSALPLFALLAPFAGSRMLNGIGGRDDIVNQVTLSHQLPDETRIDVTVIGPLHGRAAGGEWSIDPLFSIAVELLNQAGEEIADGAELQQRAEGVLRQGFEDVRILVDGRPRPFRLLRAEIIGRRCTTSNPTTSSTSSPATRPRSSVPAARS